MCVPPGAIGTTLCKKMMSIAAKPVFETPNWGMPETTRDISQIGGYRYVPPEHSGEVCEREKIHAWEKIEVDKATVVLQKGP